MRVHRASILVLGRGVYGRAAVESWAAAGLVAERYVEAMSAGGETFIVAVAPDGVLAGYCSLKDDEVRGLHVAADWARRGVGSTLLRQAEATISAGGHRLIRIIASLSGKAFYESCGLSRGRAARLEDARRPRHPCGRHGENAAVAVNWARRG